MGPHGEEFFQVFDFYKVPLASIEILVIFGLNAKS